MSEKRYAAVALLVLALCGVWQVRKWALAACALEEAKPLLKYAIHKTNCKGFPAFSEEQLARDCDCGLQAIKTKLTGLERAAEEGKS